MALPKDVKKVVLAYSGGLDTSIILKWLQTELGAEVVTFTADLGQGEELEPARKKAEMLGIKEIYIEDVREEFVRDFVFPMFRANAVYEGVYLLGTSIARPLISKHLDRYRQEDRRRRDRPRRDRQGQRPGPFRAFGLCAEPRYQDHRAVARLGLQEPYRPARVRRSSTRSRSPRTRRAKRRSPSTPTCCTPRPRARFWKIRRQEAPEYVHMRTISPEAAPDKATIIKVGFEKGDAVSINGVRMSPATLLAALNNYGRDNGIGRLDLVENRYRRHEVARRLRNARRHDPAGRAPRDRVDHARPWCRPSQG